MFQTTNFPWNLSQYLYVKEKHGVGCSKQQEILQQDVLQLEGHSFSIYVGFWRFDMIWVQSHILILLLSFGRA